MVCFTRLDQDPDQLGMVETTTELRFQEGPSDSDLLRRFTGATISCLPAVPLARFHLREIFHAQEQYKPKSFLSQAPVDILLF